MSFIEISKKNYFHNLDILCDKLGSKERLAVVLKDNAYGHGLVIMAKLSSEYGITKVIVRTSDEAKQVESYFESIIILVPNSNEENNPKYHFVINNVSQIGNLPTDSKVHLKIDTGMHRSGIENNELEIAYKLIEKNSLIIKGVMTHFRSADELSSELFWQQKNWQEIKEKISILTQKYNFEIPL
ncbi:MAG TPA: alanine racemase, partial [Campylobacterales bacterium]|nr:alanine racemase [Campylobacterales bacterium]